MHLIKSFFRLILLMIASNLAIIQLAQAAPYSGTIFFDPDIVTEDDVSLFSNIVYTGRGQRTVYDRRSSGNVTINAYLFQITFSNGQTCEAQVNPEFGRESARVEAEKYARYIGQLPLSVRNDLTHFIIHKGNNPWSGWDNWILIHTGKTPEYLRLGIVEETIIHEGVHATLDRYHQNNANWQNSQSRDGRFISDYGEEYPVREDFAETYLTWLAVRVKRDRISSSDFNTITSTVPNRLSYLDNQGFDLYPLSSQSQSLAELQSPSPGSRLTNSSETFRWSSIDSDIWLSVGTEQGGNSIYDRNVSGLTQQRVDNLPTNGSSVYVRLWTYVDNSWKYKDYDFSTGGGTHSGLAQITAPRPNSTIENTSVVFEWSSTNNDVWLSVGDASGGNNFFNRNVSGQNSQRVNNLIINGDNIYVRLWTWYQNRWQYEDYTYQTVSNQDGLARLTSPDPNSVIRGGATTFRWTPIDNDVWLSVGSSQGGKDLFDKKVAGQQGQYVDNLPTNGRTIYLRLWTWYQSRWQYIDYQFSSASR
ncbi:hypothetical protein [Pleionea sediminis]|uniref:hypothetical protein n=1 Tax=Pleionea sediminis TaxID=2569479 RepID=UPI0011864C1D|nr:hypothetical protein [Pleionea sediminis]